MKYLLAAIAFVVSAQAGANDLARQEKIAKIIEAQGLHQMFQQQLDQSRGQAAELGKDIYRKVLAESGIAPGQENPRLEQVFTRYVERCSTLFTADEMVATWARFYGSDLSTADLDKILAYYRSSAGKKDIAASQSALVGFSQALTGESRKRVGDAIEQLLADMKAAMEPAEPAAGQDVAR